MIDTNRYIGMKFDHPKFNCWTLCAMILKDYFDIDTGIKAYVGELKKADSKFLLELDQWDQIHSPDVGVLVVFNLGGKPLHCGICIDNNRFIHAVSGGTVCIERLSKPLWNKRIKGFYQWAR